MTAFGAAWIAMATAFGLHAIDEAATHFLAWYNPTAVKIRARLGVPFPPTFTFWPWFLGLLAVTAILFALSPLALVRDRRIVWLAVAFGIINVGNGLLHILAAIRFRRRVPGLLSAPLLLACATWLVVVALRAL